MRGPMMISGEWRSARGAERAGRAAMLATPGVVEHARRRGENVTRRMHAAAAAALAGWSGGDGSLFWEDDGGGSGHGTIEPFKPYVVVGNKAVIHISGELYHGNDFWEWLMGNTSYQDVVMALDAAAQGPEDEIGIFVNSPGGSAMGWLELADAVKRAALVKTVTVIARDIMCSAALGVCVDATRIVCTPTARVGSIGCIAVVEDTSGLYSEMGVKTVVSTDAPMKAIGADGVEITDAMKAELDRSTNAYGEQFRARVALGRGVSAATLKALDGAVLPPDEAVKAGLVDEVWDSERLTAWLNDEIETNDDDGAGRSGVVDDPQSPLRKDGTMKISDLTEAQLRSENPALAALLENAGAARVNPNGKPATIAELKSAFPGEADFVLAQAEACASLATAKGAYADVLKLRLEKATAGEGDKLAALNTQLAELNTRLAAANTEIQALKAKGAKGGGHEGVPFQEGGDGVGGGVGEYMALVNAKTAEIMAKDKCDEVAARCRAHTLIAKSHKEAHAAWKMQLREDAHARRTAATE